MAKFKQPSRMCILLSRENIIFGEIIRLLKDEYVQKFNYNYLYFPKEELPNFSLVIKIN